MTREHAKAILKSWTLTRNYASDAIALDMAIKALSAEPCEDCISRQAVDRLAMQYLREPTDKHVAFYEEFIALPPVTPKPKTGHWIQKYQYGNLYCSECDHEYIGLNSKPKYCEECGAMMIEPQESEDKE